MCRWLDISNLGNANNLIPKSNAFAFALVIIMQRHSIRKNLLINANENSKQLVIMNIMKCFCIKNNNLYIFSRLNLSNLDLGNKMLSSFLFKEESCLFYRDFQFLL